MNAYLILGVTSSSTKAEVKKAYKRLAQVHHPDKSKDNGEKFKEIKAAYDQLIREWTVKRPRRPKPEPTYHEPEPAPTWDWKDFTKQPEVNLRYHQVNVSFSELFGSTVRVPNSMYYVKVPYGVQDGTKQTRVECKSLNGQHIDYFNLEYRIIDPTGFYSMKMINGVKCLYCQLSITSGMALAEYEIPIRNIHPDLPTLLFKASNRRRHMIPHFGLPGLAGLRGDLCIDLNVEFKSLDEEIYPVLIALQEKLTRMLGDKTYSQHIK